MTLSEMFYTVQEQYGAKHLTLELLEDKPQEVLDAVVQWVKEDEGATRRILVADLIKKLNHFEA